MWRRLTINLGLVLASGALFLGLIEGFLVSGALDGLSIHWTSPTYKAIQERIHQSNAHRALRHPYIFNGPIDGLEKSDDFKSRIIILGDSFVWGSGLPYEQAWSRKFRRRIAEIAPSIEVVEWARNGWSTFTELKFLESLLRNHGEFEADFLLVAFGVNDLDLADRDWSEVRKEIDWENAGIRLLRKIIPNTVDFITGHINGAMEVLTDDYGYANWVRYLWSERNLTGYRILLRQFKAFLDKANIPFAFALTPKNPSAGYYKSKFNMMASMLDDLKIPYVDLFPRVAESFPEGNYGHNYRKLWANPANSHPGNDVTTVLADGIVKYLQDQGLLARLLNKRSVGIAEKLAALPACNGDSQVIFHITQFDQYQLAKGQTYIRIQGVGLENVPPELKALKAIYMRFGDKYFPTLSRLPINVVFPGGKKHFLNGLFAVDIPVDRVREPALREVAIVNMRGCKVLRRFEQALRPRNGIPPGLSDPPQIAIDALISGGSIFRPWP